MIIIATPTRDSMLAGFVYDLAQLLRLSPEANFATVQGSILPNLRTTLAKKSLEAGASHVLFIDSDMRFPADTLKRLLKHNLPVVGANCVQRQRREFTARTDGGFIDSTGKHGVESVDTLGFGVTLIQAKVFQKLPTPWFSMPWDGSKHIGEDVYFCTRAREMGFSINIDHDLSQEVKHAGLMEFGI